MPKVLFATPMMDRPIPAYIQSLENSLPAVEAAGWEHSFVDVIGCPYISYARAQLLHKFIKSDADCILFIDYDLAWESSAIAKILTTPGEVVGVTYRYKIECEDYMGHVVINDDGFMVQRDDGCIKAVAIPGGFTKITRSAIDMLCECYPELMFGNGDDAVIDIFQHGVCFHDGIWYGEDHAFCKRWIDIGGELWIIPDIDISHYSKGIELRGNFHEYLTKHTMKDAA